MKIDYRKKEIFLRFSGWFCLFPATVIFIPLFLLTVTARKYNKESAFVILNKWVKI